jgi:hypothetical protein
MSQRTSNLNGSFGKFLSSCADSSFSRRTELRGVSYEIINFKNYKYYSQGIRMVVSAVAERTWIQKAMAIACLMEVLYQLHRILSID